MTHLILLFLHVTSAMGVVAGLGIEGLVLLQLRAARTGDEARAALANTRYVQRVAGSSLLAAIITGVYLATVYWSWRGAWMGVAFITIIAMALVGAFMTGRATLRAMRAPSEGLGPAAIAVLQARLSMSYTIRLGLFLGIVFLMTTKPDAGPTALLAVLIAGALGFLAGLPARRVGSRRDQRVSAS
jgi:hypothetical protein